MGATLHFDDTESKRGPDGRMGATRSVSVSGISLGSVQSLGTSANVVEGLGFTPEQWSDLEYVWRVRVSDERARLDARARRRRRQAREAPADCPRLRVRMLRSAEWAEHRARALAMSRVDVAATCRKRWRAVGCGCGQRELRVPCEQTQLCHECSRRHWQKWRKRITHGMDRALRRARSFYYRVRWSDRRGMKPGIYLITLTAPHSGDLATDRRTMGDAVRKLLKVANYEAWWSVYALTWEATVGDDGLGHMHAHLAVISGWIPYTSEQVEQNDAERWCPRRRGERRKLARGLHDVWRDAMPGALVLDVSPPRRDADEAASAGQYLAKYVTKGIDPSEFTGRKAGELLIAFRSRRKVSTSENFWIEPITTCECCGERFRMTGTPCSLQDIAPGAVLRSMAERRGVWWHRGSPQVDLRWSGS